MFLWKGEGYLLRGGVLTQNQSFKKQKLVQ